MRGACATHVTHRPAPVVRSDDDTRRPRADPARNRFGPANLIYSYLDHERQEKEREDVLASSPPPQAPCTLAYVSTQGFDPSTSKPSKPGRLPYDMIRGGEYTTTRLQRLIIRFFVI